MEVRKCLLVDSMQRKQLKLFYSMHFTFEEQNCIIHFIIMEQSKRDLLTAMALYKAHEAMEVSRHPMAHSLLRKQHIQFYSIYSEQGSQHSSSEQSHTVKCLFQLYFTNFRCKKRINPVYSILPHIALHSTAQYSPATSCNDFKRIILHCTLLYCMALHCTAMQTMQCNAMICTYFTFELSRLNKKKSYLGEKYEELVLPKKTFSNSSCNYTN